MSATISNDYLEISSGVVSTGLSIDSSSEVTVLNGGILTDSLITNSAYVWVDAGGSIQNVSATSSGTPGTPCSDSATTSRFMRSCAA